MKRITEPGERRDLSALKAINVSLEQVRRAPPVTATLKEAGISIAVAIGAMRFSADPCVLQFLVRYDQIPERHRDRLPLEAIAISAEIKPTELLGGALLAFKALQAQKSSLMVMHEHPAILKKRIQFAKEKGGARDRDAIDTAVGFLPTPRGMNLNFNVGHMPTSGAARALPAEDVTEEPSMHDVFTPIDTELEGWQAHKSKLLRDQN